MARFEIDRIAEQITLQAVVTAGASSGYSSSSNSQRTSFARQRPELFAKAAVIDASGDTRPGILISPSISLCHHNRSA